MKLSNQVVCLSYFRAEPEYREELIEELLKLVTPTRAEPGCLFYELLIDKEDPNFLIMAEKFIDQKALDDHEKKPYVLRFVEGPMAHCCESVTWHVANEIS